MSGMAVRGKVRITVLVVSCLLMLWSIAGSTAYAHANVIRSIPANGDTLATSPTTVIAWFDEQPNSVQSRLDVFDANLNQIDLRNTTVAAQDAHQLSVSLPANLPHGTYTVRWSAVSAIDGHRTAGTFVFGVGSAPTGTAPTTPTAAANPLEAAIRWLNILAITLLSGTILIGFLVLRPTLVVARFPALTLQRLLYAAVALALIGIVLDLLVSTTNADNVGFFAALSSERWINQLFTTRYGIVLLARAALLSFVVFWLGTHRLSLTNISQRTWLAGLVLAAALLLTLSANSHNAASALWPGLSLAVDWAHLVGVAAWIGGLCVLAAVLPGLKPDERRAILAQFSSVATICVGVLALTGLYSAALQIYQVSDLWQSDYGRWLSLKLIIIAALLLLGLANNRALRQAKGLRQRKAVAHQVSAVQQRVMIEAILGIVVLLVVGFLAASPPPAPPDTPADRTLTQTQVEGDVSAALRISPNVPGQNTYSALVKLNDQPLETAKRVRLRFILPDIGLQGSWVVLQPEAGGRYTASGTELSAVGEWRIQFEVSINDQRDDVRLVYPWTVSSAQVGRVAAQPRPVNTLALGLMSMAVVVVLGTRALEVVRRYGRRAERALIGGIGLAIGGWLLITVGVSALQNAQSGVPAVNPIPPNTASITQGQALYQQICQVCHGPQGLGDGPNAASLSVPPANLRVHIALHPDNELYRIITQGSGAMPPVGTNLTPDQRWHLVNFLRTIEADAVGK